MTKVGILAVQGAFSEHAHLVSSLGAGYRYIRNLGDLSDDLTHLILPGGESTTQSKLMAELGMTEPLKQQVVEGLPVLGTCAGMILLAGQIEADQPNPHLERRLATMDIRVQRNGYGRQLGSFHHMGNLKGIGTVPMTFIRAPYIVNAGESVTVLATLHGKAVAAQQGNQLVTAFHPELDTDTTLLDYFLQL